MRRLDELFLAHPFLGSRRMAAMLRAEGRPINRKRVQRLMRLMGIVALGPKPNTSQPAPGHKIYPYLLRDLVIDQPQPGLGGRHHLPADAARVFVPGRDHRLGEPGGAGLAAVEHHGRVVLPRRARGGARPLRQARDLQHRSGQRSSPARCSPAVSRRPGSGSAWMAAAAGSTTSSSSGCGARSNTRRSTSKPTPTVARPEPRSAGI